MSAAEPDTSGQVLASLPSGWGKESPEVNIRFFRLLAAEGLRSDPVSGTRREEVSQVVFHPDRSSTPFVVEMEYGDERSVHRYDPFSNVEFRSDL